MTTPINAAYLASLKALLSAATPKGEWYVDRDFKQEVKCDGALIAVMYGDDGRDLAALIAAAPAAISALVAECERLRAAISIMPPWCTCPEGRATGPIEAHVATCPFMVKHRALTEPAPGVNATTPPGETL